MSAMNDMNTPMRTMKRCGRCHFTKPLSDYQLNRARPDGHQAYCRACMMSYHRRAADARTGLLNAQRGTVSIRPGVGVVIHEAPRSAPLTEAQEDISSETANEPAQDPATALAPSNGRISLRAWIEGVPANRERVYATPHLVVMQTETREEPYQARFRFYFPAHFRFYFPTTGPSAHDDMIRTSVEWTREQALWIAARVAPDMLNSTGVIYRP